MGSTIAITGANSAVGQALVRLVASGADGETRAWTACVRSERAARELETALGGAGLPQGSRVCRVSFDDVKSLEAAFEHAGAVVHLPGLLIERRDSSYQQANVETVEASIQAAHKAGVGKLVLVSAIGADPGARNRYYRSKGEAEERVQRSGIAFAILRAPLVLGPGTEGAAALRRKLGGRTVLAPGGGRHLEQPIDVRDLALGALRATAPDTARNQLLELVGPVALPERELLARAAGLMGRTLRVLPLPKAPLRIALAVRTRLLGAGFSPDALDVITDSTRIDPEPAARELGLELSPLDDMLRRSLEAP